MKRKALRAALPCTLPVMMGYIFLGIAFGVLLSEKGFSPFWAFLMSICIYAGCFHRSVDKGLFAAVRFSDDADGERQASVLRTFHADSF